MLIPSPRLTAADLALWTELEEADRVHGERFAFSRAVDLSFAAVAACEGPHWIGCSWGKDSVCLAHICYRAGVRWPLVFFRVPGHEPAETDAVRDTYLSRFPRTEYHEIETPRPLPAHGDRYDLKPAKVAGGAVAVDRWGRWVNGFRADESAVRKMYLRKFGLGGCESAVSPLAWWTTTDVFGYLARYDLPTHPGYAMLGGGRWPREYRRTSPIGGVMGEQYGRGEHDREYYGDVLRRLEAGR